jgi:hypothetical protein
VLNAADHFRAASRIAGTHHDPRMAVAIAALRGLRGPDGMWLQAGRDLGRVWFEVDVPAGQPSKWLTLSAIRVLAWWDAAGSAGDQPSTSS